MRHRIVPILPAAAGFLLGQAAEGLTIVLRSPVQWSGTLVFDAPRHRTAMGFAKDWPRMNTMPEWFVVETAGHYIVEDPGTGTTATHTGSQLHAGLPVLLNPGVERVLCIRSQ